MQAEPHRCASGHVWLAVTVAPVSSKGECAVRSVPQRCGALMNLSPSLGQHGGCSCASAVCEGAATHDPRACCERVQMGLGW